MSIIQREPGRARIQGKNAKLGLFSSLSDPGQLDIHIYNRAFGVDHVVGTFELADVIEALNQIKGVTASYEAPELALPEQPDGYGRVIEQPGHVPAYRVTYNVWRYTTLDKSFTWEELLDHGGTEFKVLY